MERQPLRRSYGKYEVLTNPPPSLGGTWVLLNLEFLSGVFGDRKYNWGSEKHLHTLAESMIQSEKIRAKGQVEAVLENGEEIRNHCSRIITSLGGTTHLTVADKNGNTAALSMSNGEGSGYFAPGTGIMLNNMMGEDDLHPEGFHQLPSGKRIASGMCPAILLKNGEPHAAIGTGGSQRIRTSVLQVLANLTFFSMGLTEAIEAPRIHWTGEILHVEPGYRKGVLELLGESIPLKEWEKRDMYFGGVHGVCNSGGAQGDSRRSGTSFAL